MRKWPLSRFLVQFSGRVLTRSGALVSLAAWGLLASPTAHAVIYYVEFGGGIASASKADPVLSSTSGSLESGVAGQLTLGFNLQSRQTGPLFQLGVQQRYLGGTVNGGTQKALPTYLLFRIEWWRLVLGGGYSPWVWRDVDFSKHAGASSLLAEATFLFPITPEIDFAIQGAAQYMRNAQGSGPDPSYEGLALFRLNFGMSDTQRNARRKYKGWRYPFGNPNF